MFGRKGRSDLKIDLKELLGSVEVLQAPGVRIGWPDDRTKVTIADPQRFSANLNAALRAFLELRHGTHYLVSVKINSFHKAVSIRFLTSGLRNQRQEPVEATLERSLESFLEVVAQDCYHFQYRIGNQNFDMTRYRSGNNYFDIMLTFDILTFDGPIREDFPKVNDLPWNDRYVALLELASWRSLQGMVFRFSKFAVSVANRCVEFRMSKVLIPSVGLCVDPWLFASRGLSVIATDVSDSALAPLAMPQCWPRMYSTTAFDQWDIEQSCSYAMAAHPDQFEGMPDLENQGIRESLRQRIRFEHADWADLPLADGEVDAIFATNALPRGSADERYKVLQEWIRVVRPGGLAFILQHNFIGIEFEPILREAGWVQLNILKGERPAQPNTTGFMVFRSSG